MGEYLGALVLPSFARLGRWDTCRYVVSDGFRGRGRPRHTGYNSYSGLNSSSPSFTSFFSGAKRASRNLLARC